MQNHLFFNLDLRETRIFLKTHTKRLWFHYQLFYFLQLVGERVIRAFSDPKSLFIILIGGILIPNMGLLPEKTRVRERGGLVVNASDSESRGFGFEPHSGQTVLCPWARHIYSPKILLIPRKWWLHPNMTEKLFTRTLRINQPSISACFPCCGGLFLMEGFFKIFSYFVILKNGVFAKNSWLNFLTNNVFTRHSKLLTILLKTFLAIFSQR